MTSVPVYWLPLVTRQSRQTASFCLLWLFYLFWSSICVRCDSVMVIRLYPRSRGTCILDLVWDILLCMYSWIIHVYLSPRTSIIIYKLLPVQGNLCWTIHTLQEVLSTALSNCSGSWQCCCLHWSLLILTSKSIPGLNCILLLLTSLLQQSKAGGNTQYLETNIKGPGNWTINIILLVL